jgi:pilus assembly protein FimV
MDDIPSVSGAYMTGPAAFQDHKTQPTHDAGPTTSGDHSLDFELHDLPEISEPITESGELPKVDLGGLSLDFDLQPTTSPGEEDYPMLLDGSEDDGDPMARKIDLAKEFLDFGDAESARDMLQEVIEKADNADLKAKAQAMLDKLV